MHLEVEDFISKTKYGEQLCSIGSACGIGYTVLVLRAVVDASEINPPWVKKIRHILISPYTHYRDEKTNTLFLAYHRDNFRMTLDWYMKKKDARNGLNCGPTYGPPLVLKTNNQWVFSETYKEILRYVVSGIDKVHSTACTHGHLSPNNIIMQPTTADRGYRVKFVNCITKHDLEKEEEKISFGASVKKDWDDVLNLISDVTTRIDSSSFNYELTHFLNQLKIAKESTQGVSYDSFNHPALRSHWQKEHTLHCTYPIGAAKELSKLGFLEAGVDWRKMVHGDIIGRCQESAWGWMHYYKDDYNGEFNDSLEDLLCFIKDTYNGSNIDGYALKSMGYRKMMDYSEDLFPDLLLKLHLFDKSRLLPPCRNINV